jgi:hypothetical protein
VSAESLESHHMDQVQMEMGFFRFLKFRSFLICRPVA